VGCDAEPLDESEVGEPKYDLKIYEVFMVWSLRENSLLMRAFWFILFDSKETLTATILY
jgi:Ni,Fe-hydrogenase III small subunit